MKPTYDTDGERGWVWEKKNTGQNNRRDEKTGRNNRTKGAMRRALQRKSGHGEVGEG